MSFLDTGVDDWVTPPATATATASPPEVDDWITPPEAAPPPDTEAFDRAAARTRRAALHPQSPVDAPRQPGDPMTFGGAIGRGIDVAQGMGYGSIEALGEATGIEPVRQFGQEGRVRNAQEAEQYGTRSKFADIGSTGDAAQWAKETIGEQVPMMAGPMAGGLAGGLAGAAVGGPVGATIGGVLGAFVPSLALGVGETQGNIKEKDPNAVAPGWAFAGGSAIAALDSILPGRIGARVARAFGREAAEDIAKKSLLRAAATEVPKDAALEGLTEAVQEAIGEVAAAHGADKPIDWQGLPGQMLESGAAGMLMGGLTGGASIATTHPQAQPLPRNQPSPSTEQPALSTPAPELQPSAPELQTSPAEVSTIPAGALPADTLIPSPQETPNDRQDTAGLPSPVGELGPQPQQAGPIEGAGAGPAPAGGAAQVPPGPAPAPANPPGTDVTSRGNLRDLLNDPRPVAEIEAEREAEQARQAAEAEAAANWQPTDDWQAVPTGTPTFGKGLEFKTEDGKTFARIPPTPGSREAPVRLETPEDVHTGAEHTAIPTPGQAEAGNYRKRHWKWQGLDGTIETEAGAERTAKDGSWSVTMPVPYGEIAGTKGADGDPLDISFGPNPQAPRVFIVDQINPDTGKFDEHKSFAAMDSEEEARAAYLASFSDGRGQDRLGAITAMPVVQFRNWAKNGDHKKALAYKPPVEVKPKKFAAKGALDAVQYLAANGGLRPDGDLKALGLNSKSRVMIPGLGWRSILRGDGHAMDMAVELLREGGYLPQAPANAPDVLGMDDRVREMISDTLAKRRRHFAAGEELTDQDAQAAREHEIGEERVADAEAQIRDHVKATGLNTNDQEIRRAAELSLTEGHDPIEAIEHVVERAAIEERDGKVENAPDAQEIEFARTDAVGARLAQAGNAAGPQPAAAPGEAAPRLEHDETERDRGEASTERPASADQPASASTPPSTEVTPAGQQTVIPGTERISDAEQAQRGADKGLKPKVAQKPADEGLFGDESQQTDLVDLSRKPEAPSAESDGAAWWDGELSVFGREKLLEAAGLKIPKRVAWRHLSPENQKKLLALRGTEDDLMRPAAQEAPEWAEVLTALPKDEQGRPDLDIAFGLMNEIAGKKAWKDLTPEQRIELMAAIKRGAVATAPESGTVKAQERPDGDQGRLPPGDEGSGPGPVQETQPERPAGAPGKPRGERGDEAPSRPSPQRPEGQQRPADTSGEAGGRGAGASGAVRVPERDDDGAGRGKRPARGPADRVTGENFLIEPGALDEGRSFKTKAQDNIRAIELARMIEAEGRPATRAEQAELAKYVGWGGIKGAFPDADGAFGKGFEEIGKKLKELLSDTEYATARRSIQYAHYTAEDVVRAMWSAAERFGFTGGKVFEPGMGVGNFAGMMPAGVAANTHYVGLELDHTTAGIAKLLYPKWGVRRDDFTRAPLPENAFDLVIGNPPFADVAIKSDPKYAKHGFLLHDYFFAKSLDAVRPGGLLMFISSAGTMNKLDTAARDYLADRADLVGAIRLPSNAFAKNAGTEVTTDIVILRKRLPSDKPGDRAWTETKEVTLPNKEGKEVKGEINRYFAEHPEMVLGEQGWFDKLYQGRYAVHAKPGQDMKAEIAKAFDRLPAQVLSPWTEAFDTAEHDFGTSEKKEGTFYVGETGNLMQLQGGVGKPVTARGKGVEGGRPQGDLIRIRGLIPVRDALRAAYAADLAEDTENGEKARTRLNKAYDAFVAEFGPINKAELQRRRPTSIQEEGARSEAREEARYAGLSFDEGSFDPSDMIRRGATTTEIARARKAAREEAKAAGKPWDEGSFDPDDMPDIIIDRRPNVDPFMDDPESYRLRAIEHYDEASGKAEKTAVFRENIISRQREPEIKSVNDAVLHVLNQKGRLDIAEVANLVGKSEAETIEELGDRIFQDPAARDVWVTSDEYLSGNVRKKLALAQEAAERLPEYRRNVEALEAAQPAPLAPSQIHATLGMPWIPEKAIQEFGTEGLGLESLKVRYVPKLAQWVVHGDPDSAAAMTIWGTERRRAPALISDALNRQTPKIYDTEREPGGSTRQVLNVEATQAAQEKVVAIQQKFSEWVWSDEARKEKLAGIYNENYNNLVVRDYDGSYLTTPGVSTAWSWRPHQTRVIARIIQAGNTYMAHAVGAGKTSAMIGAGMEMRRLGLVRKPMYAVPNHMLAQFTKEFYEQYPTARIAVADERRFHTDRRKQFIANVAAEDLDAVIITHSAFGHIPISDAFSDKVIQDQLDEYRELLTAVKNQGGPDTRILRGRIEKQIERLEQRLTGRSNKKRDQVFTFEEMGVDFLFVDEAHLFRKLDFATQMSNVKGISPEGSAMAWDLFIKSMYLDSINPGRSLVLASGTPVTNTMAELFTVSRYLQRQDLAERGLERFDAWAGAFGEPVSELEQDAAGGYKPVARFAKFVNVPELSSMVRTTMDVVTSRQLEQYVVRPKLKGGKRTMNLAEKTPELRAYQAQLAERMQAIQRRKGPPAKGQDIMLSVINDGRHAAIDMRLVYPEAKKAESKLELLIDNTFRIWKETKRQKFYRPKNGAYDMSEAADVGPATQMIFANLGLSGKRGFSVPDYIRAELARRGVPKSEIAFIYDFKSHAAKQKLFNDMNEGKVRILIGSTAKMATGVNAQRRLYAIHNMDPLWYPSDDEQRNGRGLRQGNLNPEIEIHDYSTKGTYDSTMWGMMARKARFIQNFFEGDPTLRDMEDLGEASQYEQAKALTTNDPRLIKLTELKQELERATRRANAFDNEQYALKQRRANARSTIEYNERRAEETRKDIAQRIDTSGDNFEAKVLKTTYTKRAEFADAFMKTMEEYGTEHNNKQKLKLAEIGGFPVTVAPHMRLDANAKVYFTFDIDLQLNGGFRRGIAASESGLGMTRSLESVLQRFEGDRAGYQAEAARAKKFLAESEEASKRTFNGDEEIARLTGEVRALEAELASDATKAIPSTPITVSSLDEIERIGQTNELEPGALGRLGFAEGDQTERKGPAFVDLGHFNEQSGVPLGQQAQEYVLRHGRRERLEYILAIDGDGYVVQHGHGAETRITASDDMMSAIRSAHRSVVVHHNHPRDTVLSRGDIAMLGFPGLKAMWAHGHEGTVSRAELTPAAKAAIALLPAETTGHGRPAKIYSLASIASDAVYDVLQDASLRDVVAVEDASRAHPHLVATILSRAGVIDYKTNFELPASVAALDLEPFLKQGVRAVSRSLFNEEAQAGGADRRAEPLRHVADMGASFANASRPAARNAPQAANDKNGRGDDRPQAPRGWDFAEEVNPFSTAADRQRAMQGFIARGQPLDRALRMPFEMMGGTTPDGRWKPGMYLFDKAGKIITGAKFSPEGRFAFLNPMMETARSGLIDRYSLRNVPEYVERDRARALDERAVMLQGAEVLKNLKDHAVGPAEARVLQAVLTGEAVNDRDMQALAEPIRAAIDQLGQEAVALGLISRESFERNRGAYLHRVYQKYESDQNGLNRMVNSIMGSKRKKIIGDQLRGRGMFHEIGLPRLMRDVPEWHEGARGTPENGEKFVRLDEMAPQAELELGGTQPPEKTVRTVWWPADRAIPDRYSGFKNQGTWEVRGKKNGNIVVWRDFTKAERVKMGEILDARYTIGKTFMLMAHDLANGRFYKDISENEDWTSTQQPAEKWLDAAEWQRLGLRFKGAGDVQWVKVPDTAIPNSGDKKRWGALAGKWVREEIWRDLNEVDVMSTPNVWRTLLTQWKLNKTARSPVVHMNNVMSNFVLMDMLDVRVQDLVAGIRSYVTKDAHYEEAFKNGAFGADMMSQEVRDQVLKPILEEIERAQAQQAGGRLGTLGQIGRITGIIWSKVKTADKAMRDAYRIEDELFRMAAYNRRRQLGDDPKQAAEAAREQFIDYDVRAPWVNAARNTVLPFITYLYRAAPMIAKAVATRPWKVGKYALLAYVANALAYAITGDDDEDKERRSLRETEQGRTWLGGYQMTRMPFNDSYGNPVFLDIRRWIPAGDVFDMRDSDMPAWMAMGGPIMLAFELALNRSAFTGKEITNNKIDDIWDRSSKRADHLWKSWVPSAAYVPGSWYWEKVADAAKGATDRQGRPYSVGQALSSSVGIKLKSQDVADAMAAKGFEFSQVEKALNAEANRIASQHSRKMLSDAEFNKRMTSLLAKWQRLGKKQAETVNGPEATPAQ